MTSGSKLRKIEKLVKIYNRNSKHIFPHKIFVFMSAWCYGKDVYLDSAIFLQKEVGLALSFKFYAKVNQDTFGIYAYILEKIQIMVKIILNIKLHLESFWNSGITYFITRPRLILVTQPEKDLKKLITQLSG